MFDTTRRSKISTSELGLYSDRTEDHRCHSTGYGTLVVKQFVIGSMIVITIVLIALFLYDVSSSTAIIHRQAQETNRVYIFQEGYGKLNKTPKTVRAATAPIVNINRTIVPEMQDRSDDFATDDNDEIQVESRSQVDEEISDLEPETRAQTLQNFKLRKRLMNPLGDRREVEEKQTRNHAMMYRVKQRKPVSDKEDEDYSSQEMLPSPFHYDYKTPYPSSFKRQKYPQLSQYRYPQSSRSIQDIIKYLSNNADNPPKGIKFSGVYMNPKKYDAHFDTNEMMSSTGHENEEEEESAPFPILANDPLYRYKPMHPADVNLLAASNLRFSPSGVQRYAQYQNPQVYYTRPGFNNLKQPLDYDSAGAYASSNGYDKKQKPKPFSVMLDIYPITDVNDQSKKTSRPRPQAVIDDYDTRRPMAYFPRRTRNPGLQYYPQPVPVSPDPNQRIAQDEEERQQLILHLNLYPRKKSQYSRNDWLQKSGNVVPDDRSDFIKNIMSPFQLITKQLADHFTIEKSKSEEGRSSERDDVPISRYEDITLEETDRAREDEDRGEFDRALFAENEMLQNGNEAWTIPSNHVSEAAKMVETTTQNLQNSTMTENFSSLKNESLSSEIDVDTVEGFQKFADGLTATE